MRSSSLTTTILHENDSLSDTNSNQQIENHSSSISTDNLLFTTTSTTNPKSSYWSVTDRQPEWYKLPIPINPSSLNTTNEIVPYKKLSGRNKSNSNNNEPIDRPTYVENIIIEFKKPR